MIFPDKYAQNSDSSTGFALFRVYGLWSAAVKKALRPVGLTHPQFTVLTVVSYLGRDRVTVSQADAAATSGIDPMTVSGIVRNLEQRGLLQRVRSQTDSRAWNLGLTTAGQQVLDQAFPLVEEVNNHFFSILDDEVSFRANLNQLRTGPTV